MCHYAGALSPQAFPPETACGLWDPEDPHHSPTLRSSSLVVIFFFSFHSFQLVKTSLNSSICKWLRCCIYVIHVSKITCRMRYTVSTRACCFTTFVVYIPLDCNPLTSESLKSAAPWNSFLPSPSRSSWKWPYCHSPCSSTKSSCYQKSLSMLPFLLEQAMLPCTVTSHHAWSESSQHFPGFEKGSNRGTSRQETQRV